jgi:hypothetical protein
LELSFSAAPSKLASVVLTVLAGPAVLVATAVPLDAGGSAEPEAGLALAVARTVAGEALAPALVEPGVAGEVAVAATLSVAGLSCASTSSAARGSNRQLSSRTRSRGLVQESGMGCPHDLVSQSQIILTRTRASKHEPRRAAIGSSYGRGSVAGSPSKPFEIPRLVVRSFGETENSPVPAQPEYQGCPDTGKIAGQTRLSRDGATRGYGSGSAPFAGKHGTTSPWSRITRGD